MPVYPATARLLFGARCPSLSHTPRTRSLQPLRRPCQAPHRAWGGRRRIGRRPGRSCRRRRRRRCWRCGRPELSGSCRSCVRRLATTPLDSPAASGAPTIGGAASAQATRRSAAPHWRCLPRQADTDARAEVHRSLAAKSINPRPLLPRFCAASLPLLARQVRHVA